MDGPSYRGCAENASAAVSDRLAIVLSWASGTPAILRTPSSPPAPQTMAIKLAYSPVSGS